jgi:hypothetical protein
MAKAAANVRVDTSAAFLSTLFTLLVVDLIRKRRYEAALPGFI